MLRFYGFKANELLDEEHQSFNPYLDPKCNWALNHRELFPVDVNRASYQELLRVPGIGVTSAKRILTARRTSSLDLAGLKKLGVVLKRAQYFITCSGLPWDKGTYTLSHFCAHVPILTSLGNGTDDRNRVSNAQGSRKTSCGAE